MIDLSNVIALALGSDDVLKIQDAIGTVLWQKTIYYTVNISAGSNGTVSVNGVSGNYSQSVPSGTVLTIEGTGNTGYNFDEWSDGNTANPRTITVNSDITLTAAFEADLENTYFYIENPNDSSITLTITKNITSAPTVNVSYSEDQIHWLSMGDTSTTGITHNVYAHGKLYLKATTSAWATSTTVNRITVSGNFNVGGNIMSLLYSDNFQNETSVNSYAFKSLFGGDTNLLSAGDLKLPATTVHEGSYYQLFTGCSSLTTAPELPATTLATKCYLGMFNGCTSLTTAPALPATTLATFCYSTMFYGCTSLTTAPVLPATTLLQSSYASLFNGCSSLNSVTSYAQDISATSCLSNWLANVAPTGTFYNNGTAVYTVDSPSGIPQGWTEVKPNYFYVEDVSGADNTLSITKNHADAPTVEVFYSTDKISWTSMGSTSTTPVTATVPANGKLYLKATADTWGNNRYNSINLTGNYNVGGNVMSLLYGDNHTNKVTFPNNSSFNFSGLFYASITLVDASNLILPATTLAEHCYNSMFYYCTGLTTAPALPATTLAQNCYYGMFYSCTALTTAPTLPASTLSAGCYGAMFYGCFNLNNVTTYADDISAGGCLNQWLGAVSATGDFYNLGTATYATNSPSGIPTGWTEHNSL